MKRRENTRRVCGRNIYAREKHRRRKVVQETCDIRREVSREDTKSSGRRIEENKVRSPWLVRNVVTSEEYGAHRVALMKQ
jgi:hypothetical protein